MCQVVSVCLGDSISRTYEEAQWIVRLHLVPEVRVDRENEQFDEDAAMKRFVLDVNGLRFVVDRRSSWNGIS